MRNKIPLVQVVLVAEVAKTSGVLVNSPFEHFDGDNFCRVAL